MLAAEAEAQRTMKSQVPANRTIPSPAPSADSTFLHPFYHLLIHQSIHFSSTNFQIQIMSGQLRHRSAANAVSSVSTTDDTFSSAVKLNNYDEYLLSARTLLAASPIHSSTVMKIHIPAIYTILPATIQWVLMRFCPKNWTPRWKQRFLIAVGEYIYRFKDENDSSPKGSPIPVILADVRVLSKNNVDDDYNDNGPLFHIVLEMLPEGFEAVFEISSLGKTQYFAVENREEANIWVNTLQQMRQDAISRSMGHTHGNPYPTKWKALDASAKRLKEKKTRIKTKLEEMNRKEQEMQRLGGGGIVGANIGYFN